MVEEFKMKSHKQDEQRIQQNQPLIKSCGHLYYGVTAITNSSAERGKRDYEKA